MRLGDMTGELLVDFTKEKTGELAVFRIVGRIDASTTRTLETAVASALGGGTPWIVYDMREVDYMS